MLDPQTFINFSLLCDKLMSEKKYLGDYHMVSQIKRNKNFLQIEEENGTTSIYQKIGVIKHVLDFKSHTSIGQKC
jgi:hypothetical protein